jgi:Rps23 Pro-64 3,4-dihydroxylase Tpa1-like proline 4-hydroxylase
LNFQDAQPFPHVVWDDFWDEETLDEILAEWPADDDPLWDIIASKRVVKKSIFEKKKLGPNTQGFYEFLGDRDWIRSLEELTGISDLALGYAGLHYSLPGGFMGIHLDFNWDPKLEMTRTLNVLTYLNKDWKPEHGGELELWNADMTECVQKVEPRYNTTAIMECSDISFHGHPDPQHGYRKSFAAYYFAPGKPKNFHGTSYRERKR